MRLDSAVNKHSMYLALYAKRHIKQCDYDEFTRRFKLVNRKTGFAEFFKKKLSLK